MQSNHLSKETEYPNHEKMELVTHNYQISDKSFDLFKTLIYEKAGIALSPTKRTLVVGRLSKRMRVLKITSFEEYYQLVLSDKKELQSTIDSLTTNETYFFREDKHLEFLANEILHKKTTPSSWKVWSAASSTGEEAYSTAMILADKLGPQSKWHIIGTDINQEVLLHARKALYPIAESSKIPKKYLNQYCLKGVRSQAGMMLMDKKLKKNIDFEYLNLNADWPSHINNFDVVFLRNVMIYFDLKTKQQLVERIANAIKPDGFLFIGHSETLNKISSRFEIVRPSVCQKIR